MSWDSREGDGGPHVMGSEPPSLMDGSLADHVVNAARPALRPPPPFRVFPWIPWTNLLLPLFRVFRVFRGQPLRKGKNR